MGCLSIDISGPYYTSGKALAWRGYRDGLRGGMEGGCI